MEGKASFNEDTGVIVVDLQADFTELKSGTLAIPGTDGRYIEAVEAATRKLAQQGLPIYLTQDWHPADHISFFSNNPGAEPMQLLEIDGRPQIMWPPHCVQDTPGAEILITVEGSTKTVRKGMDTKFDSYSGFADDGGRQTEMDRILRKDGIKNLIIYGLATDYCVKATAMDAVAAGYKVTVIEGLSKGVAPETTTQALEDMQAKGIFVKAGLDL